MSKEDGVSKKGPFGQGEFNVYSALQSQVERLKPKVGLFGPEAIKFEKEKRAILMEKEHELTSLSEGLPGWISPERQYLTQMVWLSLTEKTSLPRPARDTEIRHIHGPIGVLASAMVKSEKYQEPKLEIHLTACPSYLDDTDWEKTLWLPDPVFVYEYVNWLKIRQLADWISQVQMADKDNKLIKGIYLHTPGSDDLLYTNLYPGFFGIFSKPQGFESCVKHWAQMQVIAQACKIDLLPDVSYIMAVANRMGVDLETLVGGIERSKVSKFSNCQYIHDAYIQWGQQAKHVLELFYAGSVVGYGNREEAFSVDNAEPLKLYINCEEGWSPETFAGVKTGLDLRHIFSDTGLHLALLNSDSSIRTPWSGKVQYDQK